MRLWARRRGGRAEQTSLHRVMAVYLHVVIPCSVGIVFTIDIDIRLLSRGRTGTREAECEPTFSQFNLAAHLQKAPSYHQLPLPLSLTRYPPPAPVFFIARARAQTVNIYGHSALPHPQRSQIACIHDLDLKPSPSVLRIVCREGTTTPTPFSGTAAELTGCPEL